MLILYSSWVHLLHEQYDVLIGKLNAKADQKDVFSYFLFNPLTFILSRVRNQWSSQRFGNISIWKSLKCSLLLQKRETENWCLSRKPGKWCNIIVVWKRHRGECKAKIKVDKAGNFLEQINNQTHAPSETKYKIAKSEQILKE